VTYEIQDEVIIVEPRSRPQRHPMWAYVDRSGKCWQWMGTRNRQGYGQYNKELVHRLALILSGETLPARCHVHHICANKLCVNPAHLVALTPSEHLSLPRSRR
jgi:hypothetical protein